MRTIPISKRTKLIIFISICLILVVIALLIRQSIVFPNYSERVIRQRIAWQLDKESYQLTKEDYEKYNLTASNPDPSGLAEFEDYYENLTSNPKVKRFELDYNRDEEENTAYNNTYWRIYVPVGAGGTCSGNLIVEATTNSE